MLPFWKQLLRFTMIGTLNTAIDFTVYFILTRFFGFWAHHLVWATATAFSAANLNSYFMNRYWTFRSQTKNQLSEYSKFLIISLIGLGISTVVFHYLVGRYHFDDIVAKVVVAIILLCWNFTGNKFWTFTHQHQMMDKAVK